MIKFNQSDKKNFFITNEIISKKINYGFFSKNYGYSKNNFFSLNCSLSSDDNEFIVKKNIEKAKKNLGFENKKIKFLKQIHSSNVSFINEKNFNQITEADGSITTNKDIVLAILTADCAPLLIFDIDNKFICALHAGWRGCLKNIVKETAKKIKGMKLRVNKLIAILGPCLAKKNFEVNSDIRNLFINKDTIYDNFFSKIPNKNKYLFDMRNLIEYQLKESLECNVLHINLDTYANNDIFFSHRYSTQNESLPTGRMINIIGFKDSE